jgi:hypothetical protein
MRLVPGKAYYYEYEYSTFRMYSYVYCKAIEDNKYVVQAYVKDHEHLAEHNRGEIYRLAIAHSFNDDRMIIEEVPIEIWSLCVMKDKYHE